MGKALIATPVYISVAWTLMVSYQLFTQTAVGTVVSYLNMFWPQVGSWLGARMDMIVFIYAFAWIFVLSSVIPSVILGKERSVLVQFVVCLTLTFLAFVITDALTTYGGETTQYLFSFAVLFQNPFLATFYLLMPYILMLILDIQARRKRKREEALAKVTAVYVEDSAVIEQKAE